MVELIKRALASCKNKAQVSFVPPLPPPQNLKGKKRKSKGMASLGTLFFITYVLP